jgi:hypothetical protein
LIFIVHYIQLTTMKSVDIIVVGMGICIAPAYVYIESKRYVHHPVVSIPEVRISPHQYLVEKPQFIVIATQDFTTQRYSTNVLHGPWPSAIPQVLHCGVCEKDLLFSILRV